MIPAAVGGRLCSFFECGECNGWVGHSIEAGLKGDPCVRFGVEALGESVPRLTSRMQVREVFVAADREVVVRAVGAGDGYRVQDTRQSDGSVVKDPGRARRDIATTLRRRGRNAADVADALETLDRAAEGHMVSLGPGLAARKGSVGSFSPDFTNANTVSDACPLVIAYRFLALVAGGAIYSTAFDGVRQALLGRRESWGWRVDWLTARRPHGPWHGLTVAAVDPHVVVHLRMFGQLAWDVSFTGVRLAAQPTVRTYEIDLAGAEGERLG